MIAILCSSDKSSYLLIELSDEFNKPVDLSVYENRICERRALCEKLRMPESNSSKQRVSLP
jgi:hypothetical protein